MAKASDNLFPYVHLVPAAAPASPAAGSQRLYLDSGNSNKLTRKDSSGTTTVVEGGGSSSSGGILAATAYNPGTLASYTTTGTTAADVDATNLVVTFTAPASGKVLIRLSGPGGASGSAADNMYWELRESTAVVAGPAIAETGTGTANRRPAATFVVTGLTASSSHTYKWAWHSNAGTNTCRLYAGGGAGAAIMEVHALP